MMELVTANDDGTIVLLLAGGKTIELPEPNARQYARIWDIVDDADAKVFAGGIDTSEEAPPVREQAKTRRQLMYSEASPHGEALIAIVELLTGRLLSLDELHRWSLRTDATADLLKAWEAPLGGTDSPPSPPPVSPPDPSAPSDESGHDSPAVALSSPLSTDDFPPSLPEKLT